MFIHALICTRFIYHHLHAAIHRPFVTAIQFTPVPCLNTTSTVITKNIFRSHILLTIPPLRVHSLSDRFWPHHRGIILIFSENWSTIARQYPFDHVIPSVHLSLHLKNAIHPNKQIGSHKIDIWSDVQIRRIILLSAIKHQHYQILPCRAGPNIPFNSRFPSVRHPVAN